MESPIIFRYTAFFGYDKWVCIKKKEEEEEEKQNKTKQNKNKVEHVNRMSSGRYSKTCLNGSQLAKLKNSIILLSCYYHEIYRVQTGGLKILITL